MATRPWRAAPLGTRIARVETLMRSAAQDLAGKNNPSQKAEALALLKKYAAAQ